MKIKKRKQIMLWTWIIVIIFIAIGIFFAWTALKITYSPLEEGNFSLRLYFSNETLAIRINTVKAYESGCSLVCDLKQKENELTAEILGVPLQEVCIMLERLGPQLRECAVGKTLEEGEYTLRIKHQEQIDVYNIKIEEGKVEAIPISQSFTHIQ